jgi:hypothetical protein
MGLAANEKPGGKLRSKSATMAKTVAVSLSGYSGGSPEYEVLLKPTQSDFTRQNPICQ